MANAVLRSFLPIFSVIFFLTTINVASAKPFSKTVSPSSLGLKKEKLTHLHFFLHDILTGENPTAVQVASAATTNTSSSFFGSVVVIDDLLTAGPDVKSKTVGRAQGMFAFASQSELSLLMTINYVFTEGKFNGSTISILGRNAVFSGVRELPIVGGSGVFRFARGFALLKTHSFDVQLGNAVVEYDVYVLHY
ncbi:dirigent protein 21-like [Carica papaya]|uniref:dirigent protein 21-like n=1 Tax=Carica papaya TaxID=3649 RepID=UPI000B8C8347|nr:dirigent protein 21-like [Carica papaya]